MDSIHFTEQELEWVFQRPVPKHIAIIPDGNRRWAKQQSACNLMQGHWAGASIVNPILEAASDLGVEVLTIYSFSTENWRRPPHEVKTVLKILETYLRDNRQKMVDMGVHFSTIGDLTPFSQSLKDEVNKTRAATSGENKIHLVLAMNYGARDEMRRAFVSLRDQSGEITEEMIDCHLDTARFVDPELLIRTSGERRFSNFLLWQLAYTEIYITDTLWPDFTPRDLLDAVLDFQKRTRRLGK
ncbi:MAG: Isoprenyl transferase [Chlamydiales bacterium]|nr:Isoprenyl transferase [Chlamydiales bacterium]